MKKLAILLNIFLCLELILMPIDFSVFRVRKAQASSCPQGMNWDANLGRCLTSEDTAKIMHATASCNPQDVACYRNNAEKAFEKDEAANSKLEEDETSKFLTYAGNVSAIASSLVYGYFAFQNKGKMNTCQAWSYGLLIGAGVTGAVGELYADQKHSSNIDKIEKEWATILNTNYDGTDKDSQRAHATAAQAEAFEMLARAEDTSHDTAKTKQKFYTAAALGFGGAAIAAGVELWQAGGTGSCAASVNRSIETKYASNHYDLFQSLSTEESFKDYLDINYKRNYLESYAVKDDFESVYTIFNSQMNTSASPSIDEYLVSSSIFSLDQESKGTIKDALITILHNVSPLPLAHAEPATAAAAASGIDIDLSSPTSRLVVSLVFASWSLIMASQLGKEADAFSRRAEHLRKMKASFEGTAATIHMCKPEDRTDTSKPHCYCYTPEGQRNPARSNSQICQKLWSTELASAKGYKDSSNAFSGCINNKNEYDASCACKRSSKGCLTVSTNGIKGISTGAFSLINSGVSPINEIASGNFAKATANDQANVNNAMRNLKAAEKMLESPQLKDQSSRIKRQIKTAENKLLKAGGSAPYRPIASSLSGDLGKVAASLEKDIEKSVPSPTKAKTGETAATAAGATAKKKPGFNFDFGPDDQKAIDEQVSQVMNQKFDYAQNDIHQSQTNLFELLSNRYQRSGMRRLFDDEGIMKADAPATTDINK